MRLHGDGRRSTPGASRSAQEDGLPLPGGPSARDGLNPPAETAADRGLVEDCLRGDQRAWATLIKKYKNLIYSIPIKYGAGPDDAADVFQSVCLELFHELPRLRNTANLRPWLMTVTAHRAFHWKRARARQLQRHVQEVDAGELADPLLPADLGAEAEREQAVREALARLPERCRELVRLLFYEQPARPYAEVARSLGLATGSIGFIRARCLKRLQDVLEELGF
jgi:RNA polymerase sigma factor (sigma-70 family)